jgi:ribosomal protein S18 acetylase RimI-like enzyme
MADEYQMLERSPTLEEYLTVTRAVGWESYTNAESVELALKNSIYHVVALYRGQIVGMARIVGDGAMFYYIQDVSVIPEHRGRGIGQRMVACLMAYLKKNAPSRAFVGLFATEGHDDFYRHYGFEVSAGLTGMFQWVK